MGCYDGDTILTGDNTKQRKLGKKGDGQGGTLTAQVPQAQLHEEVNHESNEQVQAWDTVDRGGELGQIV